jgi:hypothetical protein
MRDPHHIGMPIDDFALRHCFHQNRVVSSVSQVGEASTRERLDALVEIGGDEQPHRHQQHAENRLP